MTPVVSALLVYTRRMVHYIGVLCFAYFNCDCDPVSAATLCASCGLHVPGVAVFFLGWACGPG